MQLSLVPLASGASGTEEHSVGSSIVRNVPFDFFFFFFESPFLLIISSTSTSGDGVFECNPNCENPSPAALYTVIE